jgi:DNA topoisomerase-3
VKPCRRKAWARQPPAPSIIEGLIAEKYMLREGRELIPTAKAFQLMTLLRGLGVEELSKAELTGEWEYKLAQMEHGKLSRTSFMAEIAAMTERMVKKAKEYDRDTIPGDYATLTARAPTAAASSRKTTAATPAPASQIGRRTAAASRLANRRRDAPLSRPKSSNSCATNTSARWTASAPRPAGRFTAEMVIKFDDETKNYKLEFDFGDDKKAEESGEIIDFSAQETLGTMPQMRRCNRQCRGRHGLRARQELCV